MVLPSFQSAKRNKKIKSREGISICNKIRKQLPLRIVDSISHFFIHLLIEDLLYARHCDGGWGERKTDHKAPFLSEVTMDESEKTGFAEWGRFQYLLETF